MGIVGIVVRCSLCIDSKDQVGVACFPKLLHGRAAEAGIGTGGQAAVFISRGSCPTGSIQHHILRGKQLRFHTDRQILGNVFHQIGVLTDRCQNSTVDRYGQGGAVYNGNDGKGIITSLLHNRSTFKDEVVAAGQKVNAGDTLVVLEAMKMENEIPAPKAGTVAQVVVSKGSSVNAGDVLVVLA